MPSITTRMGNVIQQEGLLGLARALGSYTTSQIDRTYQATVSPLLINGAIKKLKKESDGIIVSDNLVEFAFKFNYMGISIKPDQIQSEITELCRIIKARKVNSIIEIGRAGGGTLFLFCKSASPTARILSIDLPASTLENLNLNYRAKLYKTFAKERQTLSFLNGNSHAPETFLNVSDYFEPDSVDFLFIDGDHSYSGVKKDFEVYKQWVKKGGLIAFHDISLNKNNKICPVNKFWNELKKKYKYEEIIHTRNGYGIGLIYW